MRRELPPEPHLDHLKKQAKDLLEAHARGEPEAFERIRASVPAFASMDDDALAHAAFALHDAQSAIAREYGFKSWNSLRDEVAKKRATQTLDRDPLVEALIAGPFQALTGVPLPQSMLEALRPETSSTETARALATDVPEALPLLAIRNAFVVPGAVAPMHIGRPSSIAALDEAERESLPRVAIFAQRDASVEDPKEEDLHPIGCEALLGRPAPDGARHGFVIVHGLRWLRLVGLTRTNAPSGHAIARVTAKRVDRHAEADAWPALVGALRERALRLARGLPQPDRACALIDAIDDGERLSDLVVANLPTSVDEKARYAAADTLVEKLRLAIALTDAILGALPP